MHLSRAVRCQPLRGSQVDLRPRRSSRIFSLKVICQLCRPGTRDCLLTRASHGEVCRQCFTSSSLMACMPAPRYAAHALGRRALLPHAPLFIATTSMLQLQLQLQFLTVQPWPTATGTGMHGCAERAACTCGSDCVRINPKAFTAAGARKG